jgi:hypothetical protein
MTLSIEIVDRNLLMVTVAIVFAATIAAAQDRPSLNRSNPGSEKCDKLHAYLYRYNIDSVSQHHTGRRFVSDVALSLCARGDYAGGIKILEAEIRNSGLPPFALN